MLRGNFYNLAARVSKELNYSHLTEFTRRCVIGSCETDV